MTMSWEEFKVFLMNLQPFHIRKKIYKLNQNGANLSMLGSQSQQVDRLLERFLRIPYDQQREVFPECFRQRVNINNGVADMNRPNNALDNGSNNVVNRPTNAVENRQNVAVDNTLNNALDNGSNNFVDSRPNLAIDNRPNNAHDNGSNNVVNRPNIDSPTIALDTIAISSRPNNVLWNRQGNGRLSRLGNYLTTPTSTSAENQSLTISIDNPVENIHPPNTNPRNPLTPSLELNPRLPASDFRSPLHSEHATTTEMAAHQLTPGRQRRASITGSPAPMALHAPAPTRRRSMSVSGEEQAASLAVQDKCEQTYNMECKICMDKEVECFIMPCGHACTCYSCSRHLQFALGKCPICRGIIAVVHRLYWP